MNGLFDQRTRESMVSALLLFVLCLVLIGLMRTTGLISDRLLQLGVINIIAGLSLGLFCGGTGILSLAHIAFFGIGGYVSAWSQMNDFSRGVVDSRRLLFDATAVALPLFITVRAVDAWRLE